MMNLNRHQIAWRVAQDIPGGAYVNLGSGMPILVAEHVPHGREVIFHSENGLLGVGPRQTREPFDRNLINAGNMPVTLLPGGAFFHHGDSFVMVRGGHIDISVLGAYQGAASLGRVIGPFAASGVASASSLSMPVLVGAVVSLGGALLIHRRPKNDPSA